MLGRKVVYVRCISCSYNNVAKGIRLLEKKKAFIFMQLRAFERYIPLYFVVNSYVKCFVILLSSLNLMTFYTLFFYHLSHLRYNHFNRIRM